MARVWAYLYWWIDLSQRWFWWIRVTELVLAALFIAVGYLRADFFKVAFWSAVAGAGLRSMADRSLLTQAEQLKDEWRDIAFKMRDRNDETTAGALSILRATNERLRHAGKN